MHNTERLSYFLCDGVESRIRQTIDNPTLRIGWSALNTRSETAFELIAKDLTESIRKPHTLRETSYNQSAIYTIYTPLKKRALATAKSNNLNQDGRRSSCLPFSDWRLSLPLIVQSPVGQIVRLSNWRRADYHVPCRKLDSKDLTGFNSSNSSIRTIRTACKNACTREDGINHSD